jgi:hypothetical protein
MKKKIINESAQNSVLTWQNINKGKPIYFKKIKHWIVYEFEDMMLIATNEDLTGVFSVSKKQITY